eukprot:Seg11084.1 transcript_id=Seg11084.1/GoldUCD/mRNA.D3Y31 product="hypothetical protein" protein_id=Seg11084.1/GoldUCD/D3Y31
MPHLKTEFDHATIDQQDALQLDTDPENDTALFEDNREADQPFQASSQSLNQSPSETDDRGSNSGAIIDSNEPEERPNPIHSPDASHQVQWNQEDLHDNDNHHHVLFTTILGIQIQNSSFI